MPQAKGDMAPLALTGVRYSTTENNFVVFR
jgi:hypothetical protein